MNSYFEVIPGVYMNLKIVYKIIRNLYQSEKLMHAPS